MHRETTIKHNLVDFRRVFFELAAKVCFYLLKVTLDVQSMNYYISATTNSFSVYLRLFEVHFLLFTSILG